MLTYPMATLTMYLNLMVRLKTHLGSQPSTNSCLVKKTTVSKNTLSSSTTLTSSSTRASRVPRWLQTSLTNIELLLNYLLQKLQHQLCYFVHHLDKKTK